MKKSLLTLMVIALCFNLFAQKENSDLAWIKIGTKISVYDLEKKGYVDGHVNYQSPKIYEMDLDGGILTVTRKNIDVAKTNRVDIDKPNEINHKLEFKCINNNSRNYIVYKKIIEIYKSSIEQTEKIKKAMQKRYNVKFKKKKFKDGYYSYGCIKNNIKYCIGVRKEANSDVYVVRLKAVDLKIEKELKDKEQDEIETEAFIDEQNYGNY